MLPLRPLSLAYAVALGALAAGCAKDVVLPDLVTEAVCGNGIVEMGEQCDVASPGCVACATVPDWTCTATGCSQLCGDGVIGSGATCASPRRDSACDMTGYWAARETNYERDAILNGLQVSSNWFLFRFAQTGKDFQVVEELDCGVHVTGSATVDYTPGTLRGLIYQNRQDGGGSRPARHGTSQITSTGSCAITFDRWYDVRGAVDDLLPLDFSTKPELKTLPPIPSVTDPVNDTSTPVGATDPDGDGIPGAAFRIASIVEGTRNSAQRDWKEYATPDAAPASAGTLTVVVPGTFDLQESVLRVTDCGTGCPLIASAAHVAQDIPSRITFLFIGKTPGSTRVSAVVGGPPRQNLDVDLSTCAKVRQVLPHDPSHP